MPGGDSRSPAAAGGADLKLKRWRGAMGGLQPCDDFAHPGDVVTHCPAACRVLGQAPAILGPQGRRSDAAAEVGCVQYPAQAPCAAPAAALPLLPRQPSAPPARRALEGCCPGTGTRVQELVGPALAALPAPGLQAWAPSASSAGPGTHKAEALVVSMANPHPGSPSPAEPPRAEPGGMGFPCCPTQLPPLSRAAWLGWGYLGPPMH